MTTCLLIVNPASRGIAKASRLDDAIAVATGAGWRIEVVATDHPGHATTLARDAAARGIDVVIAHGGDGTVNEAVNGLAGSATALALLPGGTANVWAKELRISRNPSKAMQEIVSGERRRVDLGRAGERYFLLMAGAGFDGVVVGRIGHRLKRRFGALAYLVAGAAPFLSLKAWPVEIAASDRGLSDERSLFWLVLGNTRSYGGLVQIAHRATVDDGLLDAVLVRRGGALRLVADGLRLLLRRHERSQNVRYAQVAELAIETPGIAVQVDGEAHGETPMRFSIAPRALEVIVPAGTASPLFRGAAE